MRKSDQNDWRPSKARGWNATGNTIFIDAAIWSCCRSILGKLNRTMARLNLYGFTFLGYVEVFVEWPIGLASFWTSAFFSVTLCKIPSVFKYCTWLNKVPFNGRMLWIEAVLISADPFAGSRTMDWTIAGEEKSLCNEQNLGACTVVNIFFDKYVRLPFLSSCVHWRCAATS